MLYMGILLDILDVHAVLMFFLLCGQCIHVMLVGFMPTVCFSNL